MKKIVFSVASRATGRLQIKPSGSGDENDHGGSEEHRGRLVTGRSQESLEIEKLSRSIWYGSRSSVWRTKRIHDTWKVVKGMS